MSSNKIIVKAKDTELSDTKHSTAMHRPVEGTNACTYRKQRLNWKR
jgi:hypothetical protein